MLKIFQKCVPSRQYKNKINVRFAIGVVLLVQVEDVKELVVIFRKIPVDKQTQTENEKRCHAMVQTEDKGEEKEDTKSTEKTTDDSERKK